MGLFASLLGCASARIETITEEELVARLRASAQDLAPAVVFGCVWRDGTTLVRAAGHADAREGRAVLETTAFAWFSITKLFTATAIVQLAEGKRLDLDAPVSRYLPERRLSKNGREATVRQLLSHSAGLANPIPVTWIHLAGEAGPGLDALVDQRIGDAPDLVFEPGQKSSYSNLGYLLLGQIIERVSGQRYEDYVRGHLLEPLGAAATGFARSDGAAIGYQRRWSLMGLAAGWMLDARFFGASSDGYRALRPFTVDGAPYGGLQGPAADLLRFARMVLAGGQADHGHRPLERGLGPRHARPGTRPRWPRRSTSGWDGSLAARTASRLRTTWAEAAASAPSSGSTLSSAMPSSCWRTRRASRPRG